MADKKFHRRDFIKASGVAGISLATIPSMLAFSASEKKIEKISSHVNFTRDGLDFSPEEYSVLLSRITAENNIKSDSYSNGGIVEALEKKMALVLGKEAAVYMPTGTLANHIAVRKLAYKNTRVLVQAESHIYNDSGDMAQVLSGLSLIPLVEGKTNFTLDDVKKEVNRASEGRVTTGVGVISIESPIRRINNELFDFSELKKIAEYATRNNIKMHLDGARLFNACVHLNKTPEEVASLFDTVYVSLYKDFNAASGAILAGSKEFCEGLYHIRRMFGGSQPQAWPFAVVALQYVDSFIDDYKKSLVKTKELFAKLEQVGAYKLEEIPNASNVMKLHVLKGDLKTIRENLLKNNIVLNKPTNDFKGFYIKINPSILRIVKNELYDLFLNAIK